MSVPIGGTETEDFSSLIKNWFKEEFLKKPIPYIAIFGSIIIFILFIAIAIKVILI